MMLNIKNNKQKMKMKLRKYQLKEHKLAYQIK